MKTKSKLKDRTQQMPTSEMNTGQAPDEMPSGYTDEGSSAGRLRSLMESRPEESETGQQMPGASMDAGEHVGGMPGEKRERQSSGDEMPSGSMDTARRGGQGHGGGVAGGDGSGGRVGVLVEMRLPAVRATADALQLASDSNLPGLQLDSGYQPVPMKPSGDTAERMAAAGEQTVIVRGLIQPHQIAELEAQPNVVKVWKDTPIAPFGPSLEAEEVTYGRASEALEEEALVMPMQGFAACPIGTCDCASEVAKGTIGDVAVYLGVDQIWASGRRGEGIVVGVVDGGITAQGRPINSGDTSQPDWPNKLIPRVIGGWPTASWGTTGVSWLWHGNMCSTDVLGMAPNAQIYDIRIAEDTISAALAGFQWAIDRHKTNGTPQILTNSWGIFQESWDADYARNANHPFTRKVVEALDEGILVLFAAGNCGGTCPDGRCGTDSGPGKSIWGANSHPRVITVGAVNKNEQFVGYSSQGPGALDPQKPDFCSVTHFQGFFPSDSGTSAATPIAAGVVALLKQANPSLSQDQVKNALKTTAKDIGPAGWDQHSGAGIIRAKAAFDASSGAPRTSGSVVAWGANRLDIFALGTDWALYHKAWDGAAWRPSATGYESLGGKFISKPEVVSWGQNRLDIFVLGTDSTLYHKAWDGAAWRPSLTGYESMGGQIIRQPKAVAWGPNRLDIFVLGTDSTLYHKAWDGAAWRPSMTGYESLAGKIISDPEVVAWGPNRLDIFVLGTDLTLYHKAWDGSAWRPSLTGWESLGGKIIGQPKAVAWGPNRLDIFAIGTDSALYHKAWDGSAWRPSLTGWESLGGKFLGDPHVVAWGQNRLDIFVLGTDSTLYHKAWNGSAWWPSLTGWESLGGTIIGQPEVTSWGTNRLDIFVLGTNSALFHKAWDGSAWRPSVSGYENLGGTIIKF